MVLPTTDALTPCLTSRLSAETRTKWKERYRRGKKYGIRAAFSGVTGTGLVTLAKEAAADGVKRHAKRYIGGILIKWRFKLCICGTPACYKYNKSC